MVRHPTHPGGLRHCDIGYVNNDLTHGQFLILSLDRFEAEMTCEGTEYPGQNAALEAIFDEKMRMTSRHGQKNVMRAGHLQDSQSCALHHSFHSPIKKKLLDRLHPTSGVKRLSPHPSDQPIDHHRV